MDDQHGVDVIGTPVHVVRRDVSEQLDDVGPRRVREDVIARDRVGWLGVTGHVVLEHVS